MQAAQPDAKNGAADKPDATPFGAISAAIWALMWIIIAFIARDAIIRVAGPRPEREDLG